MSVHRCHATRCWTKVPPMKLMCMKHWSQLPKAIRGEVLAAYVPGQEKTKRASQEYLAAATKAIRFIEQREGLR